MPVETGDSASIDGLWLMLTLMAENYDWAEQEGFAMGPIFQNWPRSLYLWDGTNSNTFIRYLAGSMGIMQEMNGLHPGSDSPEQNALPGNTFYPEHTPWQGLPNKPRP